MNVVDSLREALTGHLSSLSLEVMLQRHLGSYTVPASAIARPDREALAKRLEDSLGLFSTTSRAELRGILGGVLGLDEERRRGGAIEIAITREVDVNVSRAEARSVALAAGFSQTQAIKVATSVSELARNIVLYAGAGRLRIEHLADGGDAWVKITAEDGGPGIAPERLASILDGSYVSKSGLGKGLGAVRRIADRFDLRSVEGKGTRIVAEFRGGA